jgi:asparagine synthase (glutamine-hydrolysing)
MCGIVGYASARPTPGLDAAFLARACEVMLHRGPDGDGRWVDAQVGLGHRRLSIIDLVGGAQPMSDDGGRYWITFNGEIYNYRELRAELAASGHRFRTGSDTEVVLAAVARWGTEAPTRLRGIFAFGLWDRIERRLLLARDHVGVKPLFYHLGGDHLVFASELKALLEADVVGRAPDPEAVCDYLALGYVLGARTVLRDVRRLPPGSLLVWHDGHARVETFWDLARIAATPPAPLDRRGERAAVEAYGRLLDDAIAAQMVSDVPVGAFLSGGVDSSTVAYHMRAHTPYRLETFSMGFGDRSYSELDWARRVATALDTDHHAEVVDAQIEAVLPDLVRAFDEPLGDSSVVPTYFVSRLARERVKVVLSGDGADESLAGYDTYVADALHRVYRRVPAFVHRHVILPASRLLPPSPRKVSVTYELKQFVAEAQASPERSHFGWRLLFDLDACRALLGGAAGGYEPFDTYRAYYDRVAGAPPLHQSLYVDMSTWLANDILTKVDRASMAVGLEARVPFLDVGLVEFTMALPPSLKMRGLQRKVVLKRAMRAKLPPFVLRRRKRGFNAPVTAWLRGALRGLAEELLTGTSELVDLRAPRLRDLWCGHVAGRADHGFRLWALVSLLLWEREVLRRRPGAAVRARADDADDSARCRPAS